MLIPKPLAPANHSLPIVQADWAINFSITFKLKELIEYYPLESKILRTAKIFFQMIFSHLIQR